MSKKKVLQDKKKKEQSKRLLYAGICAVIFVIVIVFLYFAWSTQTQKSPDVKLWTIDSSGKLAFSARGPIDGTSSPLPSGANYTLEEVVFKSFGDDVYAQLMKPKNVTKPAVVLVLPAATITKEANQPTAEGLCAMGYASLTLDERGNGGETGGDFSGNWTSGFQDYINNGTPIQYKQIYDALKGLDYIKSRPDLDGNNVAILGESIGGMWAIVAAGEDSGFKGVITVSSSDFNTTGIDDPGALRFINSVMPSNFLDNIPPRKLAMFQFDNDFYVPMSDGKALYDKAFEPKAWHQYNGTTHGLWNDVFANDMHNELIGMLGK